MASPGRLRYAALIAIGAAAAIVAWAVMATGTVNTSYARSGRLAGPGAPAGPAGSGAMRPTAPVRASLAADSGTPPRQLIVPDLVAVVPTGITTAQVNTIGALPGVRAVLAADGGQVAINGQLASVLGVPPQAFRSWTPPVTASAAGIWSRLAAGQLITSAAAASRLGLRAGSSYQVSAATRELVPFGAVALLNMPGVDAIVSSDLSARLGLAASVAVLINGPAADLATLMSQVRSVIGAAGTVLNLVPVATTTSLPVDDDAPAGRPANWLQLYQESAAGYCQGLSWTVLAAIGEIESGDGANNGPSPAGALGPMQFLPSTWRIWGTDGFGRAGPPDIMNPLDAVPAAARMLCAGGAASGGAALPAAIFAYNHATWYVSEVLALAREYAQEYS
jgi:Transglycosylase SLT domain